MHYALLEAVPHAPGHWLLGNIVNYGGKKALVEQQSQWHDEFQSDVFVIWIGRKWMGTPMVMIRDAAVAREIMVTQNIQKTVYEGLLPVMGQSLLTANGDMWKKRRRMVNPGFSDGFLRNIEPAMDECVRVWVNHLRTQALAGADVVDPHTQLALVTLDVIGLIGPSSGRARTAARGRRHGDGGTRAGGRAWRSSERATDAHIPRPAPRPRPFALPLALPSPRSPLIPRPARPSLCPNQDSSTSSTFRTAASPRRRPAR